MMPEESFSFTKIPPYVKTGKFCSIARDVFFMEPSEQHLCVSNRKCVYTFNWDVPGNDMKVEIGNDVWIGVGAKFVKSCKIGNGAIIGAFSVIAKDVPPYAVVVGNPQKITRYRFTPKQIEKLEKIKWWDWKDTEIRDRKERLKNINEFLAIYG